MLLRCNSTTFTR